MPKPTLVSVIISDLHLTLKQPACRADADWMDVQAGYLEQVRTLAGEKPVLCCGDVFDKWNAAPELLTFALKHLPDRMICIPGQHDLTNHRMDLMHRTGYGVLKEAGKIRDINGTSAFLPGTAPRIEVRGYGWNEPILPMKPEENLFHVAIVHRYVWSSQANCYPGAPDESRLSQLSKELKGFGAAFFGDNHKGFNSEMNGGKVMNVGGFIRRKSDEIDYKPTIGLLFSDGHVEPFYLDTSGDKFHPEKVERKETAFNLRAFISGIEDFNEDGLNFVQAVENHLRSEQDIHTKTKEIILASLQADNKL